MSKDKYQDLPKVEVQNIEKLTLEEIQLEVDKGGKFVRFEFYYSFVFFSAKEQSSIYFIKSGESTVKYSLKYSLRSLLLGWWSLPSGPFYIFETLWTNGRGGNKVTLAVMRAMKAHGQALQTVTL